MRDSYILRLIKHIEGALKTLGSKASPRDVEALAFVVYRCMGNANRDFHNVDHILSFLPDPDPEFTLAAIFHDIVYYQVDGGFPSDLHNLLEPWIILKDGKPDLAWPGLTTGASLYTSLNPTELDSPAGTPLPALCNQHLSCFNMTCRIFGLKPGDSLIGKAGFNEFFSCLAMFMLLKPWVPREHILGIAACIETSIPFRGLDEQGKTSEERLKDRLVEILSGDVAPEQAETSARAMVHRAIRFSNQDVTDFGAPDAGKFLSGTWRLLPELNRSLRVQGHCTVREYRKALLGMLGFFNSLHPDRVFHSFMNEPSQAEMIQLRSRSAANLDIAREYLHAKLLGITFLDAAAQYSGGDIPLSYFMGDIPKCDTEETHRLEDHLSYLKKPLCDDGAVYKLLKSGRLGRSGFDLTNSPLSQFFYESFTHQEFLEVMQKTTDFMKELDKLLSAETREGHFEVHKICHVWIESLPQHIVQEVIKALAHMAPTRQTQLLPLLTG